MRLVGLVFIMLGTAICVDQILGMLASASSGDTSHTGNPSSGLLFPLAMVIIGAKWRQK